MSRRSGKGKGKTVYDGAQTDSRGDSGKEVVEEEDEVEDVYYKPTFTRVATPFPRFRFNQEDDEDFGDEDENEGVVWGAS